MAYAPDLPLGHELAVRRPHDAREALGDPVEHGGVERMDAGEVGVAAHRALGVCLGHVRELDDGARGVGGDHAVAVGLLRPQREGGAAGGDRSEQGGEVDVVEDVGVEDGDAVREGWATPPEATARAEDLVLDLHAQPAAVALALPRPELVAQVMGVDDDVGEPVGRAVRQGLGEQGDAADGHQGLGPVVREGLEARAEARGEEEGGGRHGRSLAQGAEGGQRGTRSLRAPGGAA